MHVDACLSNHQRFERGGRLFGSDVKSYGPASWFAAFYRNQGLYSKSEVLEVQVMETRKRVLGEKVLGPKHPDMLTSMNNLASVLRSQGKYEAAEEMHRRALELREKVLGPLDPDATSLLSGENNTAKTLPKWPFSTPRADPVAGSQSLTVWSLDPDANSLPSGENTTG